MNVNCRPSSCLNAYIFCREKQKEDRVRDYFDFFSAYNEIKTKI